VTLYVVYREMPALRRVVACYGVVWVVACVALCCGVLQCLVVF